MLVYADRRQRRLTGVAPRCELASLPQRVPSGLSLVDDELSQQPPVS